MTDLTEDSRREFEEWCRKKIGDIPANPWIWEAWTARAARERELREALQAMDCLYMQIPTWQIKHHLPEETVQKIERAHKLASEAVLSETQPEEST